MVVYNDCELENQEHYYDRITFSPDLRSQDFYWEIPKTCFSENNINEILLIDIEAEGEIPETEQSDSNIQYIYDYTCSGDRVDDYLCMAVTLTVLDAAFDHTINFQAVARDSVTGTEFRSIGFKSHFFSFQVEIVD